jgi:DNA-binding Lrp family transcriptional regulator
VQQVVAGVSGLPGVRHATAVVGEWDAMVAVEGASLLEVADSVIAHIHQLDGVLRTYTAPVVPLGALAILGGGWVVPDLPMQHRGSACYAHIKSASGAVASIVERLAELDDVSGVAVVSGEHDVIAEIPLPWEQAGRVILEEIHPIPGVISTTTAVAVLGELGQGGPDEDDRDQFSAWS